MSYGDDFTRAMTELATRAGEHDEWYPADMSRSLELIAPAEPCQRAWFVTKPAWLASRWVERELPDDVAAFARAPLARSAHVRTIVRELDALGHPPLGFIGDLDPWDLFAFHVLGLGGIDGEQSEAPAVPITWLGVDDAWLALCEAHARKPARAAPTIALTPFEREHLKWLDGLADWDARVGPRAMELLRSGRKLELEGASNQAFYGAAFASALRSHLATLGRMARA